MQPTISIDHRMQRRESRRFRWSSALIYFLLSAWAMTTIYPLFWIVNNSFKVSREVMNNSFGLALQPNLINYQNAFERMNIGKSYINSLIMSGTTVLLVLIEKE